MTKRSMLLLVGSVALLGVSIWWLNQRPRDRNDGLSDLAGGIEAGRWPASFQLFDGDRPLSREVSEKLLRAVLLPRTEGCRREAHEVRANPAASSLFIRYRCEGTEVIFNVAGFDAVGGGAIPLRRFLEKCWEFGEIRQTGRFPEPAAMPLIYAKHLELDQPKLEAIGIQGMEMPGRGRVSWAQAITLYRQPPGSR